MITGRLIRVCAVTAALAILTAAPQAPAPPSAPAEEEDIKLPSGKSQRDEILKDEHQKALKDVAHIIEIAGKLQTEMEKEDFRVLSLSSLKKTEEIERLARRVRVRLKR